MIIVYLILNIFLLILCSLLIIAYIKEYKRLLNYLRTLDEEEFAIIYDGSQLFPFTLLEQTCKKVAKERNLYVKHK